MGWTHYPLVFRLLSPLHIGYRRVGNLMETRRYIPGKNLWAAITARITRYAKRGEDGKAYQQIGEAVKNHFRFGYLWPSLDGKGAYLPWEHEDFEYLFLDSHASTPLDQDRGTALEGGLHEVEFIVPTSRDSQPVYLVGDIWVQEDLPPGIKEWKDALTRIMVGGEQTYGWGKLELIAGEPVTDGKAVGTFKINYRNEEVCLKIPSGKACTSHVLAAGDGAVESFIGPVEPLVGWERRPDGHYELTEDVRIAFMPGAKTKTEILVAIGHYGHWTKPG